MFLFKGFDKDLKCRGFQYEIGREYEEPAASLCNNGFHACEDPLDCFGYYPPATSRYAEVDLDATGEKSTDDSKRVGKKIKILGELSFKSLIEAAIKFRFERCAWSDDDKATGYQGAASATGYRGAASATGDQGAASATGYRGAASATGDQGAASATGDLGAASATGIMCSAVVTGAESSVSVNGSQAIAGAFGAACKAKGTLGSWLVIAERGDYDWNAECYPIINVKAEKVDGKTIKPDTWYTLRDGKFEEPDM